jgi:hypothetical protein
MGYRKGFIRGRVAPLAGAAVMLAGVVGLISAQPAAAAGGPVTAYSAMPAVIPGNVPSVGFQANQVAELGDQVGLANNSTPLATAHVLMSSWGCQSGSWNTQSPPNCITNPGAAFTEPITFNVYAVNNSGPLPAPGALLATKTQTFTIPYRPSADPVNCTGAQSGEWFSGASCFNGLAVPITFDFTAGAPVMLPSQVIWTVAYNTTSWGAAPYGTGTACFSSSGGCGYDSLNIGLTNTGPTVGTDTDPNGLFWNTSTAANYCDGGAGGTNTLRDDTGPGCWTPYTPAGDIVLAPVPPPPLTAPSAPRRVSATPLNKGATVYWQAPASNGGSPVNGYVVTPYIAGVPQTAQTFNSTATTEVVTGLTNKVTYSFKVAAKNAVGTGPQGSMGFIVVGAPGRPANVKVKSPASGNLKVTFTAPIANGAKITSYTVICDSPNGGSSVTRTGSKSPIGIAGATAGKKYYCTVLAKNSRGIGPRSAASSPPVTA